MGRVTAWLQIALTALSLLVALQALVYVVLDRVTDRWLLAPVAVLFAGTLVQLVSGVVKLVGTERDVAGLEFVGYLVGLVLILPAATFWALGERSRGGTAVLIVAGLLVPFMLIRLDTIWTGSGV
ncbi:conserved membrane hypothetical protein [metagenome]|uniref:Integral membrane protein n=1 Tax=metagenome TaxID=256318 RepID=A0A2P2BZ41_9ZZZZ